VTPPQAVCGDTTYTIEGAGPPVVLVHGMGLNRHMWDWQMEALTRRFQVIRYDLLGHGDSDKPLRRYELSDLSDQLLRLVDGLELGPFGLAGFSLGGMIVRAFAIAHPDRVAALTILNSPHDRNAAERAAIGKRLQQAREHGPAATVDAAIERWFTKDYARTRPEIPDLVRRWMAANDPAVYPEIYRVLAESDAELVDGIRQIRCPTLVLACAEDHGNSPDMAERMAAQIPNARVAVVPGLKHMGLAEDPPAISARLVPFFEETMLG